MRTILTLASALALNSLVGCASGGGVGPQTAADIENVLSVACPAVSAIQSSRLSLNAYQKSAVQTLALACPPNPPPTNAIVAANDLVAAFSILQPLLSK